MSVKQSYLKDENKHIFSPNTSSDSVYLRSDVSLGETIADDLLETLIYTGTVGANGNNSISFVSNDILYITGGGIVNNSYFQVYTEGWYRVNTLYRFGDSSQEIDKCVSIIFKDSSDNIKLKVSNWQYNGQRLTVFCEGICYLKRNDRIAIRTYDLSGSPDVGKEMPTSIFLYKPYSQVNKNYNN